MHESRSTDPLLISFCGLIPTPENISGITRHAYLLLLVGQTAFLSSGAHKKFEFGYRKNTSLTMPAIADGVEFDTIAR